MNSDQVRLNDILDAIKEVDYIDPPRIRNAIFIAKKLTSEDQKKAVPQDWNWTSDSHDLVKDLEGRLPVAISEELRQSKEENKEKFEKNQKLQEERKRKREIEEAEEERKRKERKLKREIEEAEKKENALKSSEEKIQKLFFIFHIDNLLSIIEKGILSPRLVKYHNLNPTTIYLKRIVKMREDIMLPNGRSLSDAAHLYFNPRNAMLVKVLGMRTSQKIIIIECEINVSNYDGLFMTNRNAATAKKHEYVSSYDYYKIIPEIEERTLHTESWMGDDDLKERVMAECLVPNKVSSEHFKSIHVYNSDMKQKIYPLLYELPDLEIKVDPHMFFDGRYG